MLHAIMFIYRLINLNVLYKYTFWNTYIMNFEYYNKHASNMLKEKEKSKYKFYKKM